MPPGVAFGGITFFFASAIGAAKASTTRQATSSSCPSTHRNQVMPSSAWTRNADREGELRGASREVADEVYPCVREASRRRAVRWRRSLAKKCCLERLRPARKRGRRAAV
jgi:hypothetical protein